MIHFFIKKSFREIFLFFIPFILFVYALVIKWYLLHTRYALLIYPLMILSACVFMYDIIKLIGNKYAKASILVLILTSMFCTANLQILPSEYYYFDYTSPQPDFKWAYESIPDGQNVISGFPTMCDWYYSDRWTCINAIRVDLVHDGKTKVTEKTAESYTGIPYINNLGDLPVWNYYFVMDDLTNKSENVNKTLFSQILTQWKKIYESWSYQYNKIIIIQIHIDK